MRACLYSCGFSFLRGAILTASRLLVPRSPPGLQELPHLLEQECEGLWYLFAVAFRLLGVRWPRPSHSSASASTSAGAGASAATAAVADETTGGSASDSDSDGGVSLMPWPDRRSFELEAAVAPDDGARGAEAGARYRQTNRHHHQNRRLLPPRPGSAEAGGDAGGMAGGRPVRRGSGGGGNGIGNGTGNGSGGTRNSMPGPVLVVDDLLEWSSVGDEGPAGEGGTGWDEAAALGLEFLRSEGRSLLVRYFVADGEVQRARWVGGCPLPSYLLKKREFQ